MVSEYWCGKKGVTCFKIDWIQWSNRTDVCREHACWRQLTHLYGSDIPSNQCAKSVSFTNTVESCDRNGWGLIPAKHVTIIFPPLCLNLTGWPRADLLPHFPQNFISTTHSNTFHPLFYLIIYWNVWFVVPVHCSSLPSPWAVVVRHLRRCCHPRQLNLFTFTYFL